MSPRCCDLNLVPFGPLGSGTGMRAALLTGASVMQAVAAVVVS